MQIMSILVFCTIEGDMFTAYAYQNSKGKQRLRFYVSGKTAVKGWIQLSARPDQIFADLLQIHAKPDMIILPCR